MYYLGTYLILLICFLLASFFVDHSNPRESEGLEENDEFGSDLFDSSQYGDVKFTGKRLFLHIAAGKPTLNVTSFGAVVMHECCF